MLTSDFLATAIRPQLNFCLRVIYGSDVVALHTLVASGIVVDLGGFRGLYTVNDLGDFCMAEAQQHSVDCKRGDSYVVDDRGDFWVSETEEPSVDCAKFWTIVGWWETDVDRGDVCTEAGEREPPVELTRDSAPMPVSSFARLTLKIVVDGLGVLDIWGESQVERLPGCFIGVLQ